MLPRYAECRVDIMLNVVAPFLCSRYLLNVLGSCQNDPMSLQRDPFHSQIEQAILKGEYHCIVDLLFDWFGISI
jgi:hypothetical protein